MAEKHGNGLTLKSIKTNVTQQSRIAIAELEDFLQNFVTRHFSRPGASAVFYFDFGIRLATIVKGKLQFHDLKELNAEYLQDARIFNLDQELHLWKNGTDFSYRFRVDDEHGNACQVIDVRQNLWGTTAEPLGNGWTRLFEERGTQVIVPLDITSKADQPQPLAFLASRNYIGFMANHQATYEDNRFLAIRAQ